MPRKTLAQRLDEAVAWHPSEVKERLAIIARGKSSFAVMGTAEVLRDYGKDAVHRFITDIADAVWGKGRWMPRGEPVLESLGVFAIQIEKI